MKNATFKTTKDGVTFTRTHYTGKPGFRQQRMGYLATAEAMNATSPWEIELSHAEYDDDLEATGERCHLAVKVWPVQQMIKVEGADRMAERDALMLGKALAAASALLADFTNMVTCQAHGTEMGDEGAPALECDECFLENDPEAAAVLALPSHSQVTR